MANLGDHASVRADEVKADVEWAARLEIAVFGTPQEYNPYTYLFNFKRLKDVFMPATKQDGTSIFLMALPDAELMYEMLMSLADERVRSANQPAAAQQQASTPEEMHDELMNNMFFSGGGMESIGRALLNSMGFEIDF